MDDLRLHARMASIQQRQQGGRVPISLLLWSIPFLFFFLLSYPSRVDAVIIRSSLGECDKKENLAGFLFQRERDIGGGEQGDVFGCGHMGVGTDKHLSLKPTGPVCRRGIEEDFSRQLVREHIMHWFYRCSHIPAGHATLAAKVSIPAFATWNIQSANFVKYSVILPCDRNCPARSPCLKRKFCTLCTRR